MLFIGIGNEYRHDDAAGIVAARQLAKSAAQGAKIVEHSGEGVSLMELWENEDSVIVCDAVSSGSPEGTIHRINAKQEKISPELFRVSTHAFGVPEAIELARSLNRLPDQMWVYGIEGINFQGGTGLSPEVEKSVREVVKRVIKEFPAGIP